MLEVCMAKEQVHDSGIPTEDIGHLLEPPSAEKQK